ncbi:MAG: rod shape-determining protein MreD [Rhodobacteraceae bacterium]|nr:rod shape-determining protein MreD [Paracoccaceae bacterium]
MVDPVSMSRFTYRAAYVGLAGLVLFVGLLPLSTLPPPWPGPDLLLAVTMAWLLRRPDYVPAAAIVAMFLVQDMLTMRPPGLWTLIVLLGCEFLRTRVVLVRNLPLLLEWAMVTTVMAVMFVAHRLILAAFMVPQAGLGPSVLQLVATAAIYPLVVGASHWALGIRKVAPGEVDALGHRV